MKFDISDSKHVCIFQKFLLGMDIYTTLLMTKFCFS